MNNFNESALSINDERQNLLTYRDLSSYLQMSENTLRQYVMKRKIPFIKIQGKSVRFLKSNIDTWIEQQSLEMQDEK